MILVASGAALLFGAIFNVGQPLLAQDELGSSDAGFAVLVTAYGLGFIAGTLSGSKGGQVNLLRRRYLAGAFLMALGFATSGLAPSVAVAAFTFLAAGYGNGMLLVYERLLIQALVPDALSGRVFGIRDAITAWAFAAGFLAGPLLLDAGGHQGDDYCSRRVRLTCVAGDDDCPAAVGADAPPIGGSSWQCWR